MDDVTDMASNGTPMDVLTGEDWETPYGPGKFDTVASEKIWSWTLDSSQDDDCGNSVDWHWWAARFDAEPVTDDPSMRAGVIVEERSGGSVCATRYDSAEELRRDWESRERHYAEHVHAGCDDGVKCEGCAHCEF